MTANARIAALCVCATMAPALAQGFRLGFKAGVPLTRYFDAGRTATSEYSAATRRYTLGPSLEWRSEGGFGIEVDVLFKRTGYVAIVKGTSITSALDSKGDSWDFAFLAKYRFGRKLRPYLAAGGVVRYIGPVRARGELVSQGVSTRVDTSELPELRSRTYAGLAASAGIELGSGRFRVLPEVRFVRWVSNIEVPGDALRFAGNQAEVLVGLLF